MKKPLSILLLFVFGFNLGGYYVFFWAMKQTANRELVQKLDASNYSREEIIEIQIPFNLPYPIFNNGFERVDGKFEHKGNIYKLVKQKLVNDTLYIVCIQDKREKEITSALKHYTKLSHDIPTSNSKHASQILNKLIKDYDYNRGIQLMATSGWCRNQNWNDIDLILSPAVLDILSPPPQV